jgi:hypothetical protein
MSLAHKTIATLHVERPNWEHDAEIVDILRGVEQHPTIVNMRGLASRHNSFTEQIGMAMAIQGFLLGQAFEQANSLERLINEKDLKPNW